MTTIDEEELRRRLARLTLHEKVTLLTGADMWSLPALPGIGLRPVVMSDGPSGVRGRAWDERDPGLLFPCPSALAASWSRGVAVGAGFLNGVQAQAKGVHVLLAPAVNLHRTPFGGRHFENYSEDPLLAARTAAAFVVGLQSTGVAATVKHFVGNDSETQRLSYDARVSPDVLSALYLRPFREAVRNGAWAVMAAYNGVNGSRMTENRALLTGLLKDAWEFDGVVVSDWFAVRSVDAAAAGVDVEMPGSPHARWRDALRDAVEAGRVDAADIDDKVLRVLRLAARVGALDGLPAPRREEIPGNVRAKLRMFAANGMVLLANDGTLPLAAPRRIALLGPNARRFSAQGGGSAHVTPAHVVTPAEGLERALPDAEITVLDGVRAHARLAPVPLGLMTDPETGAPGLRLDHLGSGDVVTSELRAASDFTFFGLPPGVTALTARTVLTVAEAGAHSLSVAGVGTFELVVDGTVHAVTLDVPPHSDPVDALMRPPEHRVEITADAGQRIAVELRLLRFPSRLGPRLALGYRPPHLPDEEEFAAAVAAARAADVAVVVVGTNDDVESEGFDRTTLALPGRQDELVHAVAAVNPRTVVVVNAGAPVLLPWRDEVAAVLWAWLPGQEGGDAIADVLTGAVEPGGRLPTTFPAREGAALSPVPSGGVLDYAEGMNIGYRHYAPADVAYPFGHGLGYTTWEYEHFDVVDGTATVTLRNTGARPGKEIVQIYADPGTPNVSLAGWGYANLAPGRSTTLRVPLDRPAAAYAAGSSLTDLRLTTG
ncbi:glycoside hydrolase family 3 protein [Actinomadura flavalba]|uniref:glycoside hydrolase family 3 protein n=1 Tax=Actinomadura flavalba TaxID=1120938 RepID=UPI00036EB858|nr:glycoside hydrolase family 3 C-terminal domain-containing protein [Actinomadura flavalba]